MTYDTVKLMKHLDHNDMLIRLINDLGSGTAPKPILFVRHGINTNCSIVSTLSDIGSSGPPFQSWCHAALFSGVGRPSYLLTALVKPKELGSKTWVLYSAACSADAAEDLEYGIQAAIFYCVRTNFMW